MVGLTQNFEKLKAPEVSPSLPITNTLGVRQEKEKRRGGGERMKETDEFCNHRMAASEHLEVDSPRSTAINPPGPVLDRRGGQE